MPWEGKKPLTVMAFNEAFNLILSNSATPVDDKNHKHNAYVRVLGPKTLRKASSMLPLSSLYMQEIMQQQAATHDQLRSGLGNAIRMSTTGAVSIDLAALENNKGYNPHDLDRHHSRLISQGGNDNAVNPNSLLFSPGPRPVSKFLASRPDDPTATYGSQNSNQNSKNDPSNLSSNIQISRPDLIGVAGPMQTPKQGAKRRSSTVNKANDGNRTSVTNVNANNVPTPQAGGNNTGSNFGNAFGSAVSFLQQSSSTFMSPTPANNTNSNNTNRPTDNKGSSSVLKSMSSFFSKG